MKKVIQGVVFKGIVAGVVMSSTLTSSVALAQDSELDITANVGLYSKYIWRGWNLKDDMSIQGGVDLGYNGFYAGIWGGSDETLGTEIDLYAGYGHTFNDNFALEVGFIQYRFDHRNVEQDEVHVTADFNLFSLSYHDGEAEYDYIEANTSFELSDEFTLDLHYGIEDNDVRDWYDYSATLTYAINDTFSVFLAVSDKEDNDDEIFGGFVGNF